MPTNCMICGKGPPNDSIAIYRVNDKGKTGVWACDAHYRDARAYFPDDDPSAPGPMPPADDDKPLGPWTGGVTPNVGGSDAEAVITGLNRQLTEQFDLTTKLAAALTAAEARIKALEAQVTRVQSDREYIIGWNAGWDEAAEQTLTFPTMLRKMWSGGEVQQWINQQMAELRARALYTLGGNADDR